MKYENLIKGKLIKRYKRFLADIKLESGEEVTALCPNTGSMKSCSTPGADVYISPANDPNRKTKYTWEMIRIGKDWVGINTGLPNRVVHEWIGDGIIPGFDEYNSIRREVKFEDSRFDLFLENLEDKCFIEVKNVTLNENGIAKFPDAVTTRGRKHLETLMRVKQNGMRAVMIYFVQRMDVERFEPASEIDPDYANSLKKAVSKGVEVIVVQAGVTPEGISFGGLMEYAV